ncbi:hypothetical protein CASFOL_023667 [Castilleja foliolosa]|uniref:F-box domain-containing protein n=1 Tax=Castilleja foliolosa TaxID=1961234 RepID=A0ABD3CL64_9LAMI
MTGQTCPPPHKRNMLKATNIDSLPDAVIFEILVRVPAQDLYDSTRFVCLKWYNIMYTLNFAQAHLKQSTPGLLVVDKCFREQFFMTTQNGRIEMSKCSYGSDRVVLSSCNGLLLEESHVNWKEMYITNPVTKQQFALPLLKVNTLNHYALTYAASSRAYKVVCIPYFDDENIDLGLSIMTVGVDTDWGRRVSTQHLSLQAKRLLKGFRLFTRGFVHWVQHDCMECVLTMDVESEIITEIPGPCLHHNREGFLWYRYRAMENYLSLFIGRELSWDVWGMKPETGEWTIMPSIDLEPQKVPKHLYFEFKELRWSLPIGWSNSREVLFFEICFRDGTFVSYNVRTREIDSCEMLDFMPELLGFKPAMFLDHRNSLVWLD